MDLDARVIQVADYDLAAPPEAYVDAIKALARRTEQEGHPGVLAYQFYVNRDESTAGATIVYENADAWLAHHHLAYEWEEMPVLQATVALRRITLFGPLTEGLEGWLSDAGISYTHYDSLAAGFSRTSPTA
jgi:hypothetical protein